MGQVGCGKSTLLSAILGETEKLQGKVFVEVGIAPALYSRLFADSFCVFFHKYRLQCHVLNFKVSID